MRNGRMKNLSKKIVFSVLSTSICLVTGSTVYSVDITDKNIIGTLDNVNYKTGLKVNQSSTYDGLNISSLTIAPQNTNLTNRNELPGYGNKAVVAERLKDFNVTGDLLIGSGDITEEGNPKGSADEGFLIGQILDNTKNIEFNTFLNHISTNNLRTVSISGNNLKAYVGGNFFTHLGPNENGGGIKFLFKNDVEIYNTLNNVNSYLFSITDNEGLGIESRNIHLHGSQNTEGGVINTRGKFGLSANNIFTLGNITAGSVYFLGNKYLEHKGNINAESFTQNLGGKGKIHGNVHANNIQWILRDKFEQYGDINGSGVITAENTINVDGNVNVDGIGKRLSITAGNDSHIKGIKLSNGATLELKGNFDIETLKGDGNNTLLSTNKNVELPSTEGISKLEVGSKSDVEVTINRLPLPSPTILNKPKNVDSLINLHKLSDATKLSIIDRRQTGNKEALSWNLVRLID